MTPNDDLAQWGEPPASEEELRQARELAERLLARAEAAEGQSADELLEVDSWLQAMISTVLVYSGLGEQSSTVPEAATKTSPELRLRVYRHGPGGYGLVASSRPEPTPVRDLTKVPDD